MENFISILKLLLAFVIGMLIVIGVMQFALEFLSEITATIAAFITFTGTILAAIINNYFIKTNQIAAEKRIKLAQIESDNRKEKQKNYDALLDSLAMFIRLPKSANDVFVTIHIKSWIYGNEKIINKTTEIIELNRLDKLNEINKSFEELLILIREDSGLDTIKDLKIVNLFPQEITRGTSFSS